MNNTKEETARQGLYEKVKEAYLKHEHKVLVQAATGSGKTKIAIELAMLDPLDIWHILVPRVPLVKTWEDEIKKWGYDKKLTITVSCYASSHKLDSGNHNVILDEGHRTTERSLPFIKSFIGEQGKLIILSATVPAKKKVLIDELGITKHNTVKYSLDDAVDDDVVTDYVIKVVQFPLDTATKNIQAGRKGAYFQVTEYDAYKFKETRVRQAMYSGRPDTTKWAILDRMRFIYNLPTKLALTQLILSQLPVDKKVIIFCGSIAHANIVCKHRFHSKTTDKDYNAFCEGKINRLSVVQSVAEGVNIPELDYALIMQVQSEQLHAVQKIGRLLRKTSNVDKKGKVILLEAQNTQDSKWITSATSAFDAAKIDYVSSTQVLNKGLDF